MYTDFARFYDVVQGGTPELFAGWIQRRVADLDHPVGAVLELGCGTGAVLELLPAAWRKVGVDVSPEMLGIARIKGVDAELVEADIRSASLDRTFDLVVCVYDTINHVPVDDWIRVFAVAAQHLAADGVFLFDMNSLGRLRADAGVVHTETSDDATVTIRIDDVGDDRFDWHVRIEGDHDVVDETIVEYGVALIEVRRMLADAGFTRVDVSGGRGHPVDDSTPRLFFTCRR